MLLTQKTVTVKTKLVATSTSRSRVPLRAVPCGRTRQTKADEVLRPLQLLSACALAKCRFYFLDEESHIQASKRGRWKSFGDKRLVLEYNVSSVIVVACLAGGEMGNWRSADLTSQGSDNYYPEYSVRCRMLRSTTSIVRSWPGVEPHGQLLLASCPVYVLVVSILAQ